MKDKYSLIIEDIFSKRYRKGMREIDFKREDIIQSAKDLGISIPANVGDVLYSFRFRKSLPESILSKAENNRTWIIRFIGRSKYRFALVSEKYFEPNLDLSVTKVPNSTPGIIDMYALTDEQALLAKVRYNRLIDIFTGITCYSLQNHLRTTAPGIGQIETDEIYIGIDKKGSHYALPVQAKGEKENIGLVQIEQDYALCKHKFPNLICMPIAIQSVDDVIAMFEFENIDGDIKIQLEKHYKLVHPNDISTNDLLSYLSRLS